MKEKNYTAIIKRIAKRSMDKLSPWEDDFISDMYEKHVLSGWALTDPEKAKVLEINGKVLGRR